jgi:hypothetical protein
MYEALAWENFAGRTKWRYGFKDAQAGDVKKDSTYFKVNGTNYTMKTVFLGQNVSNLFLDNKGKTPASGYAVTNTTYYYTDNNGLDYKEAHPVAYTDGTNNLYEKNGNSYIQTTDPNPVDGKAYYFLDTSVTPNVYTYCVFLPEQTTGLKVINTKEYIKVPDGESKIDGMTYFDKYTKNFDERYVKVIKIAK